ncbi:MAG: transposase, partial [Candidatus Cryptobacteroides sp.]
MGEMNLENQLQVAFATNAELREQIDSLTRVNWSLEERLRHDAESREEMRAFYENQMDNLRREQREALERLQEQHRHQIDEAVSCITKSFEEQIAKLIAERDAALLAAKQQRGKRFARKSERNKDEGNNSQNSGENREAEKSEYVDSEQQHQKDMEKAASESSDADTGETLDAGKLVKKLKRQHPGAEITVVREDYSKAKSYMENPEDSHYHKLESYFTLAEGEYFRTGKNGEIEKSCIKILIRYPERYEEHIYEVAHVRSKEKDEYSTSKSLDLNRPIPGCMFSKEMLTYILCEKYLYHTPFRQIVKKLRNRGLKLSKSVLGEHVHKAIAWMKDKLQPFWSSLVRKSWILMIDETRTLVGCMDKETEERKYKNKYMWGLRANSVNLAWFLYEDGSRGAEVIRPFLDGFIGFYTTDGYAVYKIFDSKQEADASTRNDESRKGRRSACMVHIRSYQKDIVIKRACCQSAIS